MKVSDMIVLLEMNAWHRFLFWSVNIPRYLLGMDLVVWKCMIKFVPVKGFKKATIRLEKGEV